MSIFGGTWTCHVCGRERADALISVYSREYPILGGRSAVTVNTRYCNDRRECRIGAPRRNREMAGPSLDKEPA